MHVNYRLVSAAITHELLLNRHQTLLITSSTMNPRLILIAICQSLHGLPGLKHFTKRHIGLVVLPGVGYSAQQATHGIRTFPADE